MSQTLALIQALEESDAQMRAAGCDFTALEQILARRGRLLEQLSAIGRTQPTLVQEHRQQLLRSREAAARAMRQLLVSRQMLASELGRISHGQRLYAALAAQQPQRAPDVDLCG